MFINGVVRFIKTFLSLVVKGAAWLLFVLGLWLPCLYCLIFLIVCAFNGTAVSQVLRLFFVGLTLSVIGGLVLSYYLYEMKRKRAKVVKKRAKELKKPRDERTENLSGGTDYASRESGGERRAAYASEEKGYNRSADVNHKSPPKDENGYGFYGGESPFYGAEPRANVGYQSGINHVSTVDGYPAETAAAVNRKGGETAEDLENSRAAWQRAARISDERAEEEWRKKYFGETNSLLSDGYNKGYDYEAAALKKLERLKADDEQPLVFRSRYEKDVYIYEFSDRLQIYRRTPHGMALIEIRDKKRGV